MVELRVYVSTLKLANVGFLPHRSHSKPWAQQHRSPFSKLKGNMPAKHGRIMRVLLLPYI